MPTPKLTRRAWLRDRIVVVLKDTSSDVYDGLPSLELGRPLRRDVQQDGAAAAPFTRASDQTTKIAGASITAVAELEGDASERDTLEALSVITQELRSEVELVASNAAVALADLVCLISDRRAPALLGTIVLVAVAAPSSSDSAGGGAVAPLVALMARGSASAVRIAAQALHFLNMAARQAFLPCGALHIPSIVVQQEGAVAAMIRAVELGVAAPELGDPCANSADCALALLLEATANDFRISQRVAAQVVGNEVLFATLVRAMEIGRPPTATKAVMALNMVATDRQRLTISDMLSTEATVATLARLLKSAADGGALGDMASLGAMGLLPMIRWFMKRDGIDALCQRQGVIEAAAAAFVHGGLLASRQVELLLLYGMGGDEEHRGAVAHAVVAALHTCTLKDSQEEAHQRVYKLLTSDPFTFPRPAINALLRAAKEAAELRAEMTALEAVPANIREAIVELAVAVRGGYGA